jgi:hypothetical protein
VSAACRGRPSASSRSIRSTRSFAAYVSCGVHSACFAVGDSSLGGGDDDFVNRIGMHTTQPLPEPLIRLGVLQLYDAQFVKRWPRDSLIYGAEDLALLVYDPIRESGETVMQAPPERDAVGWRGGTVIAPSPAIWPWRTLPPSRRV